MTFADMLKAWLEAEGMSQTAFAKKVGLSHNLGVHFFRVRLGATILA
jgi:transcriptional regulator with XRE-family HTH domain